MYEQKPHLGTDKLIQIVKRIRTQIEQYGGTVRFNAEVTDFKVENGLLTGLVINGDEFLPCKQAV